MHKRATGYVCERWVFIAPSNTINVRPTFLERDLGECYIKQEKSKDEKDVKQKEVECNKCSW